MSTQNLPVDLLEERAEQQRRRLHHSVSELKTNVRETVRERLEPKVYLRKYFWQATVTVSLLALLVGHGTAGLFTRR
jgi:hypothetical protein